MPPRKQKGNKKGKAQDSTPTTEYVPKQNQEEGFPRAETEEEKTLETQESQEPISHQDIPDSTPKNAEEIIQPVVEEKVEEVVQEKIEQAEEKIEEAIQETKVEEPVVEEPIAETVQENIQAAEEKIEEAIQETKVEEPVVAEPEPVVEAVQENIEVADAKLEEVISEPVVTETLEIPAQNAEESRPLSENRLFTIESEQQPARVDDVVENVITEEKEAVLEEKEQVAAPVEAEAEKPVLTSSLQNNWEEIRTEKPAAVHEDLTKSHIVVDNSLSHEVTSAELLAKAAPEKRPSLFVQDHDDDIRSDKASDNALQTRLMDEYSEAHHVPSTFSTQAATTTPADRLHKAEEQIIQAKGLKTDGKPEEAITLLLNILQSLNPESFNGQDQVVLGEVNQKIRACTIELSECYNQTNDFNQSIKYARAVLNHDLHNVRAVYLLGIGLIRLGDLDEAHSLLRQSKDFPIGSADTLYSNLIDKELEKLDQIAESRSKTPRANSGEEAQPLLNRNATGSVDEVPEEKVEGQEEKSQGKAKGSAAEYFLGSLISTGALSFAVAKYLFKFPTKKGVLSAIVVGAVVGGVSLIVQSAIKKNEKTDKKEQQ